jgi:hypothetical protein
MQEKKKGSIAARCLPTFSLDPGTLRGVSLTPTPRAVTPSLLTYYLPTFHSALWSMISYPVNPYSTPDQSQPDPVFQRLAVF